MALSKKKLALAAIVTLLVLNTGVIVTLLVIQSHRTRQRPDPLVSSTDANGFISLFNGNDLTGWKYNSNAWSVVDGTILGRVAPELGSQSYSLIWSNGLVDDFELHLKFRTMGTANSGLSMRAQEIKYGRLYGYQAEIESSRTGLFFISGPGGERTLSHTRWRTVAREENGQDLLEQFEPPFSSPAQIAEARRAVLSGEWCDYAVIAQGPHVVIVLNGITMTDTRDEHPTKFVPSGFMGLDYSHTPGREDSVEFKDILFKRLNPVEAP
jgi:hypothetical protein